VEIVAGALSGGAALGTQGVGTLTTTSGSCAAPTNCTSVGTQQLEVLSGGCLSGTITGNESCPLPASLAVQVVGLNVASGQRSAGVRAEAYIGTTTPADGGAFCAPGIPGDSVELIAPGANPTSPQCQSGLGITPIGSAAISCSVSGGSACASVGSTQFSAD
jgi:hypothetical protein